MAYVCVCCSNYIFIEYTDYSVQVLGDKHGNAVSWSVWVDSKTVPACLCPSVDSFERERMLHSAEEPEGRWRGTKVRKLVLQALPVWQSHDYVPPPPSSTFIDPETRSAMGAQAVALAKAVGYSSAGEIRSWRVYRICHWLAVRRARL